MTGESRPENNVDTPGIEPMSTDYKPKVLPIIPRAETRRQLATSVITKCNIYEAPLQEGTGLTSIRGTGPGRLIP